MKRMLFLIIIHFGLNIISIFTIIAGTFFLQDQRYAESFPIPSMQLLVCKCLFCNRSQSVELHEQANFM